ncbi:MAG: ATP-binding protein, partial [Luteimonas sp.]
MTPPLTLPPPPAPGPVLVGFSGGLDSTVLLHLLAADEATRERGLRAIHVHHGLLEQADAWADHCRGVCAGLDVALEIARVSVARDSGLGLEAAARQARYQAF